MRKALIVASLAAGTVLAAAGGAHAEPAADPTRYSDVTATFVDALDPAALEAKAQGKNLIMSPYGVSRTIACRGDGAAVPYYDCQQEDDLGWITLRLTDLPGLGPTWYYLP
ncbi:hypothetical protein [Nocardia shimofusensis]|uniref:hypothetical protein n=1 Tax=Nocardia shimofusensis TaxID=228596 RepID=UPI00082A8D42|nr:hypothetical protein [Nocardia shimofusensis]